MFNIKGSHSFYALFAMAAFFVHLFSSCSLKSKVAPELRQLDSLHIVLQTKLEQLKNTDTLTLDKAVKRYIAYSSFIENNIRDTVSKDEATTIQQFYSNGNNLKRFQLNRAALLARMKLVSSQITKLKTDADNNAIRQDVFMMHYTAESKVCKELIALSVKQMEGFNQAMSAFKSNLLSVETFIKKRNSNELPAEVSTTSSL
jgi:hypothetical protein